MFAKQLIFLISLYYLLGCQKKKKYTKKTNKTKTLSGLQKKGKDPTH